MKLFFISLLLLIFNACVLHYDKLSFYNSDFKPDYGRLNLNGFYYGKILDDQLDTAYRAIFFYSDGTCSVSDALYYDSIVMVKSFEEKVKNFDAGAYRVFDDSLYIEYLHKNSLDWKVMRIDLKGVVDENKIDFKNTFLKSDFHFVKYQIKPDSTQTWLKTHRKYRIKQ